MQDSEPSRTVNLNLNLKVRRIEAPRANRIHHQIVETFYARLVGKLDEDMHHRVELCNWCCNALFR